MNISTPMLPQATATPGDVKDATPAKGGESQGPSQLFSLLLSGQLQGLHPVLAGRGNGAGAGAADSEEQPGLPQDGNSLPLAQVLAALLGGAAEAHQGGERRPLAKSSDPDASVIPAQFGPGAEAAMSELLRAFAAGAPAGASDKLRAAITEALSVEAASGDKGQNRILQALAARIEASHLDQPRAGGPGHEPKDLAAAVNPASLHAMVKPDAAQVRASVPATVAVEQPLHQSGWDRELGSRIVWMTRENLQSAQLRLNPPHLGPVEVRVSIQHDMANVSFIAHHAQVRDAIEAAIPRLREMMGANGFNQTHVDVSGHSFAGGHQHPAQPSASGLPGLLDTAAEDDLSHESIRATVSLNVGMVDYFA